jgi:RNA polymerase sigma factor (TIGR02999 family)
MRHILVDHARRKATLKHGGRQQRLDIDEIELAESRKEETILMVDAALERLEQVNPKRARIVTLRFFGGMTNKEVAEVLGISERTVARQWICARTWLVDRLRGRE